MKKIIALCALLACLPASAQQIYRWVDADGRVQYSDKPPPGVKSAPVQERISSYSGAPVISGARPAAASATRAEVKMYSTGGRGVPLIVVGAQRMTGFSADAMRQLLKTSGY